MGVTKVNGRVGKQRRIREGFLLRMYDKDYCIPFIVIYHLEVYRIHIFCKSNNFFQELTDVEDNFVHVVASVNASVSTSSL